MKAADRYPAALLATFAVFWAVLAIRPWYRQDWLLENMLVFVAVPLLAATYRSLRFSNFAYTCLFAFFVLHEIGAHYTYSEVPWREWLVAVGAGDAAGTDRNHYDRFVHLCYGLLMFPATWELFAARAQPQRVWRYVMPVTFLMAHSVLYEMVEWLAAELFGGDLGVAYLGTQGDEWDSQKDMALASLGATLGLVGTVLVAGLRTRAIFAPPPACKVPTQGPRRGDTPVRPGDQGDEEHGT